MWGLRGDSEVLINTNSRDTMNSAQTPPRVLPKQAGGGRGGGRSFCRSEYFRVRVLAEVAYPQRLGHPLTEQCVDPQYANFVDENLGYTSEPDIHRTEGVPTLWRVSSA